MRLSWSGRDPVNGIAGNDLFISGPRQHPQVKGAALTYRVTGDAPDGSSEWSRTRNTNRGHLAISIDGGPARLVPTFAGVPRHRVIIWQGALIQGTHTLELVNAGRRATRAAIDSILLTSPPTG